MNYHDFHLNSYEVTNKGETITLHLVYDYPDSDKEKSDIQFNDVIAYNFIHTGGTIITSIEEVEISIFLNDKYSDLAKWNNQHGIFKLWNDDITVCQSNLENQEYKSWYIDSAIGFEGFVLGKEVKQIVT